MNSEKVVREHWKAGLECQEAVDALSVEEAQETETDDRQPRTTAIPSKAYKAVKDGQVKSINALEEARHLNTETIELLIEGGIRSLAMQYSYVGANNPVQREEFLQGLRDGVKRLPRQEFRNTSRYHFGYDVGRSNGATSETLNNLMAS